MKVDSLARWLRVTGLVALHRTHVQRRGRVTILCLHRVEPTDDPLYPSLAPAQLRSLCRYLKPRYRIVRFQDLSERSMRKSRYPLLILSFDDGYRDFYEHAMPVLLEEGVRANLNVITTCADTGRAYPWQASIDFLRSAPDGSLQAALKSLGAMGVGGGEDRHQVGLEFTRWFQELSIDSLHETLARLENLRGPQPAYETKMMTWSEIREADRLGFEIGSHSVSHASLDRVPQEQLDAEIAGSKGKIERELGHPIDVFAFPGGRMNENAFRTAKRAGYANVLAVGDQLNDSHHQGVWLRVLLYGRTLDRLIIRATGLEISLRNSASFRRIARVFRHQQSHGPVPQI